MAFYALAQRLNQNRGEGHPPGGVAFRRPGHDLPADLPKGARDRQATPVEVNCLAAQGYRFAPAKAGQPQQQNEVPVASGLACQSKQLAGV